MYKKVEKVPFSRLFLYYNARGGVAHDNGISVTAGIGAFSGDKPRPRDVLYIHDRKGCCKEEIWPYEKDYTAKPNDTAYTDAMNYQVHPASSDVSFTKLNDNTDVPYDTVKLRAIKKALYENNRPVPFGLFLMGYEATRAFRGLVGESSMISTPSITCAEYIKQDKNRMKALGKTETEIDKMHFTPGHSMLIVGYNDTTKLFTLRNSYGSLWGDNGYCRASYDLILSNWAQDFWVMKRSV
jgi:C1A family cysteine protease